MSTAVEALKRLNEFLLGPEQDVKAMSSEEVRAYLKDKGIDTTGAYKKIRAKIERVRSDLPAEPTS